ncbi:MAG: delta-60 repeat domain-containing protein [Candidatus Dojkabacteria bacterium]|jgi:uncharacterized delta-60 repeat protein
MTHLNYNLIRCVIKDIVISFLFLLLLCTSKVFAEANIIVDPNFSSGTYVGADKIAVQSDGKILTTEYRYQDTVAIYDMIRRYPDGKLDSTFKSGSGFNYFVDIILPQEDGTIYVGGGFTKYDGVLVSRLVRLNADGSIDESFSTGAGITAISATARIYAIDIQPDGKVVVGGQFSTYDGTPAYGIVRLNQDGSIDNTFSAGSGTMGEIRTIKVKSNGKILAGGNFITFNDINSPRLVQLNTDGSIDSDFNIGSGFSNVVRDIVLQSDGKILVGGEYTYFNGTANRIIRLNEDGSIDDSFNTGTGFNNIVYSIVIQSDDKILVGGLFSKYNENIANNILRLNEDGSIDSSFTTPSKAIGTLTRIVSRNDGNIWLAGNLLSNNGIMKLHSDGSVDTNFSPGRGFNKFIRAIETQSNGKILVGGDFTKFDDTAYYRIVRLNSDGSIDNSFNIGTGFNNSVYAMEIQSDNKILVGGTFTSYNGFTTNRIVRLNQDGSIDNTFVTGTGLNNMIYSIVLQSDQKILLGGTFTNYNGSPVNRIIRLNSDGSVDNQFVIGTGLNNMVYSIVVQLDSKIVVGGDFTKFNGSTANRIVRLNSDGSIDDTFVTGTGFNKKVTTILSQTDGKLLVGGYFTSYNGVSVNSLIRLNVDGSVDNTFNIGDGFGYRRVDTICLQPNNKIIVGGGFFSYNGVEANRIIRLNTDGSIDDTFKTGRGFNGFILTLHLQSDEKILVGGQFSMFDNKVSSYFTRIMGVQIKIPELVGNFNITPITTAVSSTTYNKVILSILVSNPTVRKMMVSNTADFAGGLWEEYKTSKEWTLSEGSGEKTVYIKFMDDEGSILGVFTQNIIIQAPTLPNSGTSSIITILGVITVLLGMFTLRHSIKKEIKS